MPTTYAIPNGRTVMDATTYTGTGSSTAIVNAGGFKPDLVWVKNRNTTYIHNWTDSVRGISKILDSASTAAELNDPTYFVTAFNSNGFTQAGNNAVGSSGNTYVGWQWQAGQGTTSSNTSGSITSTVSVNASAGFSIVSYTSPTSGNFTIGHGLGVAPSLIINKARSITGNWLTWHIALPGGASNYTYYMVLNLTDSVTSVSDCWGNAPPNSTTFGLQANYSVAGNTDYISYCWAQVAGFSQFGSYTGNGSTDGPFIYTGFRPKFVMIKPSSATGEWIMWDTTRSPSNFVGVYLFANSSAAEGASAEYLDLLSNGFKIRTTNTTLNANGQTNIYMAFAENPFKYANAR